MMTAAAPVRVVGLGYTPGQGVPRLTLKAAGLAAERVLAQGRSAEVSVVHNPELLEQLFRLPVDGQISEDLFGIVACVLAHVLSVDGSTMDEGVP